MSIQEFIDVPLPSGFAEQRRRECRTLAQRGAKLETLDAATEAVVPGERIFQTLIVRVELDSFGNVLQALTTARSAKEPQR